MKLTYSIVFTSNMEGMAEFYRDGLGLVTASESPFFTEFRTGATSFALLAVEPRQKLEFELCFTTPQIETEIERLRERGMTFIDEVRQQPFGRIIHMRDPEETLVTLLEPTRSSASGGEPELGSAIVNAWDFGTTRAFYRDRLGLPVVAELPGWIEFGTDGARIVLQARAERPDAPAHTHQKVAYTFDLDDLEGWARGVEDRGIRLATEPADGDLGVYAEAVDPDGNLVVFREPAGVIPAPRVVAAAYEDDAVPKRTGIRKPVKKGSKAVSRVALRPEYKSKPSSRRRKAAITRKVSVAGADGKAKRRKSIRGGGPERTRLEPVQKSDPERIKTRQAVGRLRKAERRTIASKKQAVATASKGKPVKRAAANRGRRRK